VAAHLGPSRYRQLHFEAYDPAVWPNEAVSKELAEERQLGGIAEFVFPTSEARRSWENSVGSFADADDGNVFRRSTSYTVSAGGFSEASTQPPSDSDEISWRIFVMLKAAGEIENFKGYLRGTFLPKLAASDCTKHAQLTLLDPYDVPDWIDSEAGVDRTLRPDEQHQALLEIVFKDRSGQDRFFGQEFPVMEEEIARHVNEIHAYKVKGAYTHIADTRMTLTGWLGAERAKLVAEVGAKNIVANLAQANSERARPSESVDGMTSA
jgi:hypothetical protein